MVTLGLGMAHRVESAIVGGLTCAFVWAAPMNAKAGEVSDAPPSEVSPAPRATPLSVGALLVPGLVVHGSGHFVAGDARTGRRLLVLEGIGLGTLALGFVPIVLTGASRRLVGVGTALSVSGVGLFAISALADLYGVLAPPGGTGEPSRVAPMVETELGYRYVYNPIFSYRDFVKYGVDYRVQKWRVHPSALFAFDQSVSRVRVPVAVRLAGPMPNGVPSIDGSYLDLEAAGTRHSDVADGFSTLTGEVSIAGRLDMQRVAPSLEGSFAEGALGWALQNDRYAVMGVSSDVNELLLARFGYGMYVGRLGRMRGEIQLYYDHRHDDFAAGLKVPGIGSGVAGHFGVEGRAYVSDTLGFSVEAVAGSAYVVGASALVRVGDPL
jgi:hypothetical protein